MSMATCSELEALFKQLKLDLVSSMSNLQNQMSGVRADIEEIKTTLKEHGNRLQCAPFGRTLLCRQHPQHSFNQLSSMMSRREILEDFYILGRKYEEGGDCCLAAAEAWEFYNRLHTLMRPKLVTGILYSDSVLPKLKKTGISPPCLAGISPLYQAFRLDEGCIWIQDDSMGEVMNVNGASHRVTLVTTLDGDRVVVDWGIGQFTTPLPHDVKLFIRQSEMID